jgi:hypothetical protein
MNDCQFSHKHKFVTKSMFALEGLGLKIFPFSGSSPRLDAKFSERHVRSPQIYWHLQ